MSRVNPFMMTDSLESLPHKSLNSKTYAITDPKIHIEDVYFHDMPHAHGHEFQPAKDLVPVPMPGDEVVKKISGSDTYGASFMYMEWRQGGKSIMIDTVVNDKEVSYLRYNDKIKYMPLNG